jgi:synaptobrevin homolog YKT6
MVKLTSVAVLKYNGPDREPTLLGFAADLSTFGFFQRGTVREMLAFVGRTVARRTQVGQRQTVQQDEYFCHAHNRDGLVGVAFVDADYPARAGFCVVAKVLDDYAREHGDAWRGAAADAADPALPLLEAALQKYQDPAAADQLARIQRDLDETKVVLHRTIESVLERGEKLDALVDKSADLSMASQMFYKQARKANSCCTWM